MAGQDHSLTIMFLESLRTICPKSKKTSCERKKTEYTKGLYVSDELGVAGNTYNWRMTIAH